MTFAIESDSDDANSFQKKLWYFSKVLSVPLVSEYSFETRKKLDELGVPLGMLWIDTKSAEKDKKVNNTNELWLEHVRKLWHKYSGEMWFVQLNTNSDGILLKNFGLDPRKVPCFGIWDLRKGGSLSDSVQMPSMPAGSPFGGGAAVTKQNRNNDPVRYWFPHYGPENFLKDENKLEDFIKQFLSDSSTLKPAFESIELNPDYKCTMWVEHGHVCETSWKNLERDLRDLLVIENESSNSKYSNSNSTSNTNTLLVELYHPQRPQHQTRRLVFDILWKGFHEYQNYEHPKHDTSVLLGGNHVKMMRMDTE